MPLQLVAPGARIKYRDGKAYPNRFWLVRGELAGRSFEVSTKTRDEIAAQRFKAELELRILDRRVPSAGEAVGFKKAAELWKAKARPSKGDWTRIERVIAAIGPGKDCRDIQHADLVAGAFIVFPDSDGYKNETRNRWFMKPAASILHYAAGNKWCPWLRIEKLQEGPKVTRAAKMEAATAILAALDKELATAQTPYKQRLARKKRLLIVWLMKHGNRISDPLRLTWEDQIDLHQRTYHMLVGKGNKWRVKPIDEEVFELLANDPGKDIEKRVFPWHTRSGVYKWLRPLTKTLGVAFTPHMARHSLGKRLNAAGQGLKTVMGALDHDDPASSARYMDADLPIVRGALAKTGRLFARGKAQGKSAAKARKIGTSRAS